MKFSRLLNLYLFIALFSFSFAPLFSENSLSTKIRVGYYENEVFQEGAKPGSVKKGYAYEYYQKISEYTGWKYEYIYGSYGELYQMLLDGKIDLLAGLAKNKERENKIAYPENAMGEETYSLLKHDSDEEITSSYTTLNGKSIGILNSAMVAILENFLKKHSISAKIVTFDAYDELFDSFDSNQVDILAAEGDGAYGRLHAQVLYTFGSSEYYLCVNINREDLLSELNKAQNLLATEEPNYLNCLKTKFFPVSISSRAFSDAEKLWIATHKKLRVGFLKNYLPYSDTTKDGKVTGIVQEILPKIMEALGVSEIEISYVPYENYTEMTKSMARSDVDVIFPVGGGLYYSEENGIYQSTPLVSSSTEMIYNPSFFGKDSTIFAVNKNNSMQYYYVKTNFPKADILFCDSIESCLEAVLFGEASSTTINGLRNEILKNRKYRSLSIMQLKTGDDRAFGIEIGNEGLLKLLNRGINILEPDYAQNLAYRYTQGLYSYTSLDFFLDNLGLFTLLALLFATFLFFFLIRDARRSKESMRLAENANKAKTTFLNSMSHDIRTPMNAIVGFTTLAKANIEKKEQVLDYLEKISVSSLHLLSLINDVLDMSSIESGKVTIEESPLHLPSFINDLKIMCQASILDKNIRLNFKTEQIQHKNIITDKVRLNQILLNILSNAIKFSNNGGKIDFEINVSQNEVNDSQSDNIKNFIFKIRDNGCGMSESFQKELFDTFTREKTSTDSGLQGTGLGMAITKRLVELMNGSISVESREGEGTLFTVTLPIKINGEKSEEEQETVKNKKEFEGKRLLLAEDNEMNQLIAKEILENSGFTVEIANDGEEAVQKVKENPEDFFDIVLMDIQMPKMDGYEATKKIRALPENKKATLPIIAVTANALDEDKILSKKAGHNAHLSKPYDIEKMMKAIREVLFR